MIGLPYKEGKWHNLYDYQNRIFQALENSDNKYIWIKKSTGLGISEFYLRYFGWLCVKDDTYQFEKQKQPVQFPVVTGPNEDLAIELIKRFKNLFRDYYSFPNDSQKTATIGNVTIEAFPSNHLDAMRSLTNPKQILFDEGDFFRIGEQTNAIDTSFRYVAKSNPVISFVSTPNVPGGLFERIENEKEQETIWTRIQLPWTVGLNKIYSQENIDKAKKSSSFQREYNLQYGYGIGNLFSDEKLEKCTQINYDPSFFSPNWTYSLGIDIGWGSSKSSFVVTCLNESNIVEVCYCSELEKPDMNEALAEALRLIHKYDPQKVNIDASKPEFIRLLKSNLIGEDPFYEEAIKRYKAEKVDWMQNMRVIPRNFATEGRYLYDNLTDLVSNVYIAISPQHFNTLLTQMRTAKFTDTGHVEKSKETRGLTFDSLDALGLSCLNWRIET